MPEPVLNALILGILGVLVSIAMHLWRRPLLWVWTLPVGLLVGAALKLVDSRWALTSMLADPPWRSALILGVWWLIARSGLIRTNRWSSVVLAAALVGDEAVAIGLSLAEPDTARRARLVLAASGASLIGPAGGAASLVLGWAGVPAMGLGLALAIVGFCAPAPESATARPSWGPAALTAPLSALAVAIVVWWWTLSGALEFVAVGLELLPMRLPGSEPLAVLGGGVLAGALLQEGVAAVGVQEVLSRTLDVSTEAYRLAATVGLAVGGGLPLLLLSGSRLRTGVGIWALQVAITLVWAVFFLPRMA